MKNFIRVVILLNAFCLGIILFSFNSTIKTMDQIIDGQFAAYAKLETQHGELIKDFNQVNVLQRALTAIDVRDYNRETNNCYDHSKRLQTELAKANIASSIMINKDRNHAWLAVWIESTNGKFISSTNSFEILEVRDNNLNVVCKK